MTDLKQQVQAILSQIEEMEASPNKRKSKDLRVSLGKLKTDIPIFRKELMELDNKGY